VPVVPPPAPPDGLPDLGTVSDRTVARMAVANLVARVAMLALGVVTTAIVARSLGVDGFAAFTYAIAWGALMVPLTDFGLNQAAVNRLSVREVSAAEITGSLLLMRLMMSLVVGTGAAIAAVLTAPDDTVAVASVVICIGLVLSTPAALVAVVQTAMRPIRAVISMVLNSILWFGAVVALALADLGVVWFAIGVVTTGTLASLLQARLVQGIARIGRPSRAAMMSLLRLSAPLGVAAIAAAVYYRIGSILLYQIGGSTEAGHYAAAYRLVEQIQVVPMAIVGAVFPILSQAAVRDPARLRRFLIGAWEILLGFALPIVTIGLAVAHPVIAFLFGPEFEGPAGDVMLILWPVVLAIFLGYLAGALVPALNLVKIWIVIAVAGAIVNVGLNLLLLPSFGARGAAVAAMATEFPVMIATLGIALRRAGIRLPMGRVWRLAAAAAIAGVVAFALTPFTFVASVVVGMAVYVAVLPLLGVVPAQQLWRGLTNPRAALKELS
jgi:O-antigen/teichoic acid export membrane protein